MEVISSTRFFVTCEHFFFLDALFFVTCEHSSGRVSLFRNSGDRMETESACLLRKKLVDGRTDGHRITVGQS